MTRRTQHSFALFGLLALVVVVTACSGSANDEPDPVVDEGLMPDEVRFQGVLPLADATASIGGERSLANAALGVAALPITTAGLDPDRIAEAPVDDDGSFEADGAAADGVAYALLISTTDSGVGVRRLQGWTELPVGGELSTGWPVRQGTGGTVVELGSIMQSDGSYLPGTDAPTLYDTLGVDQAELLFQAERDNYLKHAANEYLNQESPVEVAVSSDVQSGLDATVNATISPADVLADHTYTYTISLDMSDSPALNGDDVLAGNPQVALVPPAPVTVNVFGTAGPGTPLVIGEGGYGRAFQSPDSFYTIIEGAAVPGPWDLTVGGAAEASYAFDTASPFDADGNYIYYLPVIRVDADPTTTRVAEFTVWWFTWDPARQQYTELEGTIEGLPGLEWWSWGFASHASDHPTGGYEDIDLELSVGSPVAPGVELYLDNPPPGAYRLSWVYIRYAIGGIGTYWSYRPDRHRLFK